MATSGCDSRGRYSDEIRVFCTLEFESFHRWPDAPLEVEFLRQEHRHIFHVRAEKVVTHDDRDVEFILLKRKLEGWIKWLLEQKGDEPDWADTSTWSCEKWASTLLNVHDLDKVEVSEDGENGAIVERKR